MAYFSIATYKTAGNAATTQNLVTLTNGASSAKTVKVKAVRISLDTTAAITSISPQLKLNRVTGTPSGGTSLTSRKFIWDTKGTASNTSVTILGATASDGGAATAITATLGSLLYQPFGWRLHTAANFTCPVTTINMLPQFAGNSGEFILVAGESLVVSVAAIAAASNPSTNNYLTTIVWEEV